MGSLKDTLPTELQRRGKKLKIDSRLKTNSSPVSFQVSSKGSLTGGYFNKSRSRLEIQKTRSEKMDEITSQEDEMRELRQKLNDVEAEINKVR